eukprot:3572536-Amphidinium_carterae.2
MPQNAMVFWLVYKNALLSCVSRVRMRGPPGMAFRGFESTFFVLRTSPGSVDGLRYAGAPGVSPKI